MRDHTGSSYPHMALASDYGLPYATVLRYADAVAQGYDPETGAVPEGITPLQSEAAERVGAELGKDARRSLHAAVVAQLNWMAAQHAA